MHGGEYSVRVKTGEKGIKREARRRLRPDLLDALVRVLGTAFKRYY
jgi:hypothetical protein